MMAEPEISITIKVQGIEHATAILKKLAEEPSPQNTTYTIRKDLGITVADSKEKQMPFQKRAGRKRLPGPEPATLVQKGWLVRGPYNNEKKSGNYVNLHLVNPANQKEYFNYSVGPFGLSHEKVKELIKMAKPNESGVGRRGVKVKTVATDPKPKEKQPDPVIDGCSICSKTGLVLGSCKSDESPHCLGCCDKFRHKVE